MQGVFEGRGGGLDWRILHLLAAENQSLLDGRDALFFLHALLDARHLWAVRQSPGYVPKQPHHLPRRQLSGEDGKERWQRRWPWSWWGPWDKWPSCLGGVLADLVVRLNVELDFLARKRAHSGGPMC